MCRMVLGTELLKYVIAVWPLKNNKENERMDDVGYNGYDGQMTKSKNNELRSLLVNSQRNYEKNQRGKEKMVERHMQEMRNSIEFTEKKRKLEYKQVR